MLSLIAIVVAPLSASPHSLNLHHGNDSEGVARKGNLGVRRGASQACGIAKA
jgi:hypothetical protein